MRENKIEAHLRKQCELYGYWCLKFPPIFMRGFPDRIVMMPRTKHNEPRIVFVELKAPNQKPRPLQQKVHDRLRGMGFDVFVLDSINAVDAFILTE